MTAGALVPGLLWASLATAGLAAQDTTHTGGNDTLPPAGFGTLKQEDIALQLEVPGLILRVIPLAEPVIRLLSPDTYASLHRLSEARRPAIDSAAKRRGINNPTVFLVAFFGLTDRVPFSPDEVTFTSRNQLFRPSLILPVTPGWSTGMLNQRTTATAIYVLEQIPVLEPLVVTYGGVSNSQWETTLRALDQERAQVLVRATSRHQ
jgi:hypothetical protein